MNKLQVVVSAAVAIGAAVTTTGGPKIGPCSSAPCTMTSSMPLPTPGYAADANQFMPTNGLPSESVTVRGNTMCRVPEGSLHGL
jgi:hypothetical protein